MKIENFAVFSHLDLKAVTRGRIQGKSNLHVIKIITNKSLNYQRIWSTQSLIDIFHVKLMSKLLSWKQNFPNSINFNFVSCFWETLFARNGEIFHSIWLWHQQAILFCCWENKKFEYLFMGKFLGKFIVLFVGEFRIKFLSNFPRK